MLPVDFWMYPHPKFGIQDLPGIRQRGALEHFGSCVHKDKVTSWLYVCIYLTYFELKDK